MKRINILALIALSLSIATPPNAPAAVTLQTVASFNGANGASRYILLQGTDGNFYGPAETGGAYGLGTVFKLTPDGALTALVSFDGGNGAYPSAALVEGADGNFYGTTDEGGANNTGTVFVVTPEGNLTMLHSFSAYNAEIENTDGVFPSTGMALGCDGNFYGSCYNGGIYAQGTLWEITPGGVFTVLYSFTGGPTDGSFPSMGFSGMTLTPDCTFYGTTFSGGTTGGGTAFVFTPGGTPTVLASFGGNIGMINPNGALALGQDGNFYGTTQYAGSYQGGTAYKMTPEGTLTLLASFDPNTIGYQPVAALLQASDGNFYGTLPLGGPSGSGSVFKLAPDGTLTLLVAFDNGTNGGGPETSLILGSDGNFYGTTVSGGAYGFGTVFRLSGVIEPATLTITANPQTKIYGQADPVLTYGVSGLQGSDTASTVLTGSLARAPGEDVGAYAITQGSLAANSSYTIAFTPSTLTITPAALTVTPNAVSTTYDGAALGDTNYSDNTGNYSITGFQNGDDISSAGVTLSGSMDFNGSTATTVENAGSYALTQGTLSLSSANGNYLMSFSNPSLNAYIITPATLTVTANSLTKSYGSPDPTLTYTVSGLQGGDTASTVLAGSLARAPGQDVGTYAISQGTLAAHANYTISFVPGTLTVTEVKLTITWPANILIATGGACSTANLPALNIGTPTYTPSIPDVAVTSTRSDGQSLTAPYHVGITTITWTVTDVDDGGYSATYNQTVEVTDDVSISGNFNGTRIPAASTIWFTAVLTPQLPRNVSGPVTIWFFAQNIASSAFNLTVPNATVVFDPNASLASATCDALGRWTTRAPCSGLDGNTLLATYAYQLPPGQSLPSGLQPVKWDGTFATDTPGVTLQWQWSAAVYSQFGNCSNAGVKCTDDPFGDCNYKNSDCVGTPENYKLYVIGGGLGGGGLNSTGSLCGAKAVVPCVESTAP